MKLKNKWGVSMLAWAVAALATTLPAAAATRGAKTGPPELDEPWAPKAQWMSFRLGYAKSAGELAPNGGVGGGIGYSRMLSGVKLYKWTILRRYSLGAYAHLEQVGRFASATELSVPITAELVRHYKWSTYLRPYVGLGGGTFYRKLYRSGDDIGRNTGAGYVVLGVNSPAQRNGVLGLDFRYIQVDAENKPANPVFGAGDRTASYLSFKVNYALTY